MGLPRNPLVSPPGILFMGSGDSHAIDRKQGNLSDFKNKQSNGRTYRGFLPTRSRLPLHPQARIMAQSHRNLVFHFLVRKLIRRGNFASKQMLKTRIEQFITYFHATMARPFRWTYAGKPLAGAVPVRAWPTIPEWT